MPVFRLCNSNTRQREARWRCRLRSPAKMLLVAAPCGTKKHKLTLHRIDARPCLDASIYVKSSRLSYPYFLFPSLHLRRCRPNEVARLLPAASAHRQANNSAGAVYSRRNSDGSGSSIDTLVCLLSAVWVLSLS